MRIRKRGAGRGRPDSFIVFAFVDGELFVGGGWGVRWVLLFIDK